MNAKTLIIVGAIVVLIATFFIDARLTPVVGAAALFVGLIYGWWSNRNDRDSYRKAEEATHRQKETHSGPRDET